MRFNRRSFLKSALAFDPAKKQIVGDDEANALLKGSKGTPPQGLGGVLQSVKFKV